MKKIIVSLSFITLALTGSENTTNQAPHIMETEIAQKLETMYKKERGNSIGGWDNYWNTLRSDAAKYKDKAHTLENQQKYQQIMQVAQFLEKRFDYFAKRDTINAIVKLEDCTPQAINDLQPQGIHHPLCQKIQKECEECSKENATFEKCSRALSDVASTVSREKITQHTVGKTGKIGDRFIYKTEEVTSQPTQEMLIKGKAVLYCLECIEKDRQTEKFRQEFENRLQPASKE